MPPIDLSVRYRNLRTRLRTSKVRVTEETPIFVICRDRVTPLRVLVSWLESEGQRNIIFVDNDSTYPPLLRYFEETRHTVLRLGRNVGQLSPWEPEARALRGTSEAYVVTDPDILPEPGAGGSLQRFALLLNRYPGYVKAGFGLRTDDLPERYIHREAVQRWEAGAWTNEIAPGVFQAPIDTTFALYRPGSDFALGPALRTGSPFLARHEPWYRTDGDEDPELQYYYSRARVESATWRPTERDEMYDEE